LSAEDSEAQGMSLVRIISVEVILST